MLRAEVLVGVAEGDRAGVGHAEQEVGEIRTGGGAGEGEGAARILLREEVELLAAEVAADREVVRAVAPEDVEPDGAGLIAGEGLLAVGQPGDAAGEGEARRSPVLRLLVVAGDAGLARRRSGGWRRRASLRCEPRLY